MIRVLVVAAIYALGLPGSFAQELKLPNGKDSFPFAVIGDSGTGGTAQYAVAKQMEAYRKLVPYGLVIMMGDNIYGGQSARDIEKKFEQPYAALLRDGVKFYATLGNHDSPNQRFYKNFHMDGKMYYSFQPRADVRFFVMDSNRMSKEQLDWLDQEMGSAGNVWKIVYFHHPLYSSGERHGSSSSLRRVVEPILLKHRASLVLGGHEHFYERIQPQKGVPYFIVGSSAKLRKGNINRTELTAKGNDTDNVFMLCEIDRDTLHFQVISAKGATIDSGRIERPRR